MGKIPIKLIAHRGNFDGPSPGCENNPDYVEITMEDLKFDCEIDIWKIGKQLYLGHDQADYPVSEAWLRKYKHQLILHCKNSEAFGYFQDHIIGFHYFWHEGDRHTLTSRGMIWSYPQANADEYLKNSIVAVPEMHVSKDKVCKILRENRIYGVCSDNVLFYRNNLVEEDFLIS